MLFAATIGIVTRFVHLPAPPISERAVRDAQLRRETLELERPQVVLLGNSMLGHGVNVIHFAMRTGLPIVKMWDGGVMSAWNYMTLKNLIIPSPGKPELVIVFFTDHYITEPTFRVDGVYRPCIDVLRHTTEPVLDRLAYGQNRDPLDYLVSEHWSLPRQRPIVKPLVENWVKGQVGDALDLEGTDAVNAAIARTFADHNLNKELFGQAQLKAMGTKSSDRKDFSALVELSFLPAELEIARNADIRLVYVRIKRVLDAEAQEAGEPSHDSPYLTQYMTDLRSYLESQGAGFLDFSTDLELKVEHFADGDHLGFEGRLIFTRLLAERLRGQLPSPKSARTPFAELRNLEQPVVLKGPFQAKPPFAWMAPASEFKDYANGPGDPYRSILEVFEDGVPLGPSVARTSEVADNGAGRFTHWQNSIYFSSSDGTDPNTNGRTYTIRFRIPR